MGLIPLLNIAELGSIYGKFGRIRRCSTSIYVSYARSRNPVLYSVRYVSRLRFRRRNVSKRMVRGVVFGGLYLVLREMQLRRRIELIEIN